MKERRFTGTMDDLFRGVQDGLAIGIDPVGTIYSMRTNQATVGGSGLSEGRDSAPQLAGSVIGSALGVCAQVMTCGIPQAIALAGDKGFDYLLRRQAAKAKASLDELMLNNNSVMDHFNGVFEDLQADYIGKGKLILEVKEKGDILSVEIVERRFGKSNLVYSLDLDKVSRRAYFNDLGLEGETLPNFGTIMSKHGAGQSAV